MQPALRITDAAPPDRRAELATDGTMSVAEAVAFSGVSQSELYATMDRGELPFVKWGRRRLIPRRALVELLARHMTGGQS
jgi:excisionase family DNA binding protein